MKQLLAISIALGALSLPVVGHLQAQGAGNSGLTVEGGVAFINPGSPVVPAADADSQPLPRLSDGKVDLTGPWVGGGTIADIERDGGLKPGELPLLAVAVLGGAFLGTWLGLQRLKQKGLLVTLAVVMSLAGTKLLLTA